MSSTSDYFVEQPAALTVRPGFPLLLTSRRSSLLGSRLSPSRSDRLTDDSYDTHDTQLGSPGLHLEDLHFPRPPPGTLSHSSSPAPRSAPSRPGTATRSSRDRINRLADQPQVISSHKPEERQPDYHPFNAGISTLSNRRSNNRVPLATPLSSPSAQVVTPPPTQRSVSSSFKRFWRSALLDHRPIETQTVKNSVSVDRIGAARWQKGDQADSDHTPSGNPPPVWPTSDSDEGSDRKRVDSGDRKERAPEADFIKSLQPLPAHKASYSLRTRLRSGLSPRSALALLKQDQHSKTEQTVLQSIDAPIPPNRPLVDRSSESYSHGKLQSLRGTHKLSASTGSSRAFGRSDLDARSLSEGSLSNHSNASLSSARTPFGSQVFGETQHEGRIEHSTIRRLDSCEEEAHTPHTRIVELDGSQDRPEAIIRSQAHQRFEALQSKTSTPSAAPFDMPGEKGGWRSRFGGKKSHNGEEGGSDSASALAERFNLDKKPSMDSLAKSLPGSHTSGRNEEEMAAQHIARQQRARIDARLASIIPLVDDRHPPAPLAAASTVTTSPLGRLEEYRRVARDGISTMANGQSKLERMMGEQGGMPAPRDRSTQDHSSWSGSQIGAAHMSRNASGNDDAACPVCLELLSFRLAGERAHVVPNCGHALHHACFTAVYGSPESIFAVQSSTSGDRAGPPGMCGVCRRLIVLSDEGMTHKIQKAAGMMGVSMTNGIAAAYDDGDSDGAQVAVHDDSLDNIAHNAPSRVGARRPQSNRRANGATYDPLSGQQQNSRSMVLPAIKIRPEFDTVYRKERSKSSVEGKEASRARQNVVCVISVTIPSRRLVPIVDEDTFTHLHRNVEGSLSSSSQDVKDMSPESVVDVGRLQVDDEADEMDVTQVSNGMRYAKDSHLDPSLTLQARLPQVIAARGKEKATAEGDASSEEEGFSFGVTPVAQRTLEAHDAVVEDLRSRVVDWKGHSIERFGPLLTHAFLGVRQDEVVRDFYVYLFKDALLCVNEERKKEKPLSRLIASDRSHGSVDDFTTSAGSATASAARKAKTPLKLKGRIWLRHIRRCQEMEVDGKPCLSIKLDDESLDQFVLCFKKAALRSIWCETLTNQLKEARAVKKQGGNAEKAARGEALASPALPASVPQSRSANGASAMSRDGTTSDSTAPQQALVRTRPGQSVGGAMMSRKASNGFGSSSVGHASPIIGSHSSFSPRSQEATQSNGHSEAPTSIQATLPRHQQWSASGGLDPSAAVPEITAHTALDLVIMVSVPSIASQHGGVSSSTLSSSAALKLRLIRSTLTFVVANLGPKDRIALVSYQVGLAGIVRRTALLNAAKSGSKAKLQEFVESIGEEWDGPEDDPFREDVDRLGGQGDRTDTVTAVNVGFDIVLQRKSKNPVTGMLLINDTADAPKRVQMDLIMARAEAANVPVHCFGFGKSLDPSSLWLVSNHTRGSYTFVKEWYQLRECVAGCVGALMSVALTEVRLHISVPSDNHFRVRKVSGCTGTIISSSGKDVDLEMGEMRFGESRELFVELELDFAALIAQRDARHRNKTSAFAMQYEKGSATDDFMQRLGLQGLSLSPNGNGGRQRQRRTDDSGKNRRFGAVDDTDDDDEDDDDDDDDTNDPGNNTTAGDVDEVAVMEVQCGCRDPAIGVGASRLPDAGMLTLEVDAVSRDPTADGNGAGGLATALADPVVTRRRLEILVSDMVTRCLLLVSRRNHAQALTLLLETRRIVETVLQAIPLDSTSSLYNNGDGTPTTGNGSVHGHGHSGRRSSVRMGPSSQASLYGGQSRNGNARKQRDRLHRRTALSLTSILEDLDVLIDGLESGKTVAFERSERNFGAQQAMVLRDQKAWTSRTDTEWHFFKLLDNGPAFAALAAQYSATFSR